MTLTVSIESAELRLKQILEDFFVSVYNENALPSHGIDHHRRVWRYAKELLKLPPGQNILQFSTDPSKLIIACYLHDIGMTLDPGSDHGKKSRDLCINFLNKYRLDVVKFSDVLETIEEHDKKDYILEAGFQEILTILSVADDLDAFGYTGIYRYSEVYLARDVSLSKLGNTVIENVSSRYENFIKWYGHCTDYMSIHKKRFEIINNFFGHYNKQVRSYDFGTVDPEGYCGVIQLFRSLNKNQKTLKDLFTETEIYSDDIIISSFLNALKKELKSC